jgi:hypothetical protein
MMGFSFSGNNFNRLVNARMAGIAREFGDPLPFIIIGQRQDELLVIHIQHNHILIHLYKIPPYLAMGGSTPAPAEI